MDTRPREDELHAWADGQLPRERAAAVAAWLAQHPDEAARVAVWQAQRMGLQALHAELLDTPPPPHLVRVLHTPRWRWQQPWAQAMAAAVLLAVGMGLGYGLGTQRRVEASSGAARAPGFVREAVAAHAVYVPELRHPVEVDATQQQHLVQWLSKRLGTPLRVPTLDAEGYRLIGGRLLPGESGQARAQFMYEDASGARITLFVSVLAPGSVASAPAAFHWTSEGATQTFYWVDGSQGYALSAALSRSQLEVLATAVYRQLEAGGPR